MLKELGDGNCFSGPPDRIHVQEAQHTEGTVNLGQGPQKRKEEVMKKMKKFFAMFLALAMVLGMSVTTFAANNGDDGKVGTDDDKGTITVSGIVANKGTTPVSVTAYQIIKAKYDNGGKTFAGYEVVDKYKTALASINTNADVTLNIDNVNAVVAVGFTGETAYPMSNTTKAPTVYAAEVPVGTYIVMIQNADTVIYSPVIVSVAYTDSQGGNAFVEGSVNVIADGNAWVKESSEPSVDKKAKESATAETEVNSVDIGDTVYYDVDITPVPFYNGTSPVLNIVDNLSAGLTLNNTPVTAAGVTTNPGIVVKGTNQDNEEVTLTENTDYTVTISGQQLTVNFVVNGSYKLNNYQGKKVTVSYNATVNNNAVINEHANDNGVTLNFTRDSNQNGNDGTKNDKTYTYTFDIGGAVAGSVTESMLTKTGETLPGTSTPVKLGGAEFTLYTKATEKVVNGETVYTVAETDKYTNTVFNGTATSAQNTGKLSINGLAAGTYYLKETKAPAGYSLNEHVFVIKIDPTYADDGQLISWKITIDDKDGEFTVNNGTATATKELKVEIPNTKITTLPSTGGIGTTIFTVGGCAIMIIAAGLYFSLRRRTVK